MASNEQPKFFLLKWANIVKILIFVRSYYPHQRIFDALNLAKYELFKRFQKYFIFDNQFSFNLRVFLRDISAFRTIIFEIK